jgi:universal stress protein A
MSFGAANILAALDGSTHACEVFDAAAELARCLRARLHVLRVVTVPPSFPAAAANRRLDTLPAMLRGQALRDLLEIAATKPDARVEPPLVEVGAQPWREIVRVAEGLCADIIVLGSHSRSGLEYLLGSTANNVVNHADTNVFLVRYRGELEDRDRE